MGQETTETFGRKVVTAVMCTDGTQEVTLECGHVITRTIPGKDESMICPLCVSLNIGILVKSHEYIETDPYKGCGICGFGPGAIQHNTSQAEWTKVTL